MPQVFKRLDLLVLIGLLAAPVRPIQAQTATTATFSITGEPMAGILQAGDGNFYSISVPIGIACKSDATMLCSYIYQITPTGNTSVFYAFQPVLAAGSSFTNSDGVMPVALIAGTDGNLYGACLYGGPSGGGTIFKLTGGVLSVVKSFSTTDPGASPNSLIEGADGNFYFTNINGIYQLNAAGAVTTVFSFPSDNSKGNNATSLMQRSDNNFYVTLDKTPGPVGALGGDVGAIVQISPGGQWSLVHSFAPDGSEGKIRGGPLAQGKDGTLFGVTKSTGNTVGTVFQVSPGGAFKLIHTFPGNIVGSWNSALFLGSDGNFYGVTLQGGDTTSANCTILPTAGCGTVYQVTPSGTFSILHNFEGGIATSSVVADNPQVDGGGPTSPLVQGPGGIFYGTADGVGGSQTAFSVTVTTTPPVPSPVQLTVKPTTVLEGNPVTLSWSVLNAFSGTQQVCGASVPKNASTAGQWTGPQVGKLVNGLYSGSAIITPTAPGTYTYALTCGGNESGFVSLVVLGNTPLQIQTMSLPKGTVPQPYQTFLQVSGGISPYQWVVSGLPKGLTLSALGLLSGTPMQYGSYPLSFGVQDSTTPNPQTTGISLTLTVDSGLTLFPTLQNPVVGKPYSQALSASGGLTPYSYTLASGALPPGLQFNATAGVISGTVTQAGQSSFSISLSDSENPKAMVTQTFSLTTGQSFQITSPGFLPDAQVGIPYSTSLTATGGLQPYTWSFGTDNTGPSRQIPQGLTLSSTGVLSGTPIQWNPPNSYDSFSVVVTDSSNPPVSVSSVLGLACKSTLKMLTTNLPIGQVGASNETPLQATGGIPPYKWQVAAGADANAIGLYLNGDVVVEEPLQPINTTATIYLSDSETLPAFSNLTVPLIFLPAAFPTTTTLSSSNIAAGTGENVTFTAKVVQTSGVPAGLVNFYNGATIIGTATLDANGNAAIQTSFSTAGVYSITAVYGGETTSAASMSAAVTETVVTPSVSASINPATLTIKSGSSGQLIITLTPAGDYSGTVNFSCGTLPPHVSCSFAPPSLTIAAGSGPVTDVLTVSTNALQTAALLKRRGEGTGNNMFAALTLSLPGPLAGMVLLVRRKRIRAASRNFWMAAMLCLFCVAALTSCGGSPNKAAAGTYQIPIALTVSGGVTQNISATVIVE